jgi:hypothetical protein
MHVYARLSLYCLRTWGYFPPYPCVHVLTRYWQTQEANAEFDRDVAINFVDLS